MSRTTWSWLVLAGVLLVALIIGTRPDDTPRTTEEHVFAIAETVRCPTCRSQSVADSEAPVSRQIRAEIARRVAAGDSDDEIRDYLVGRFGQEVLLTPSASGVTGLVWIIPVVAVAAAVTGLVLAFRRWQRRPSVAATEEDRSLVAQARERR
jgi:cytochrome c-type biogenesis protein CcmH